MPSPLDFFQAGQAGGKANALPDPSGNLMDMFNRNMQMRQQMNMLMGTEYAKQNILNQIDPLRQKAAADLQAETAGSDQGTSTPGAGSATSGSVAGSTSSANPATPTGGMMIEKSRKMLNKTFENPAAGAADQQVKDTLRANQSFSGAMNMIRNMYSAMAGMHQEQGGGGALPGMVGSMAQKIGSLPHTQYLGRFDTAAKDLAANTARQWSGSQGGVARLVAFFNAGGMPSRGQSEENNLAILQQQAINNYSLAKAHGQSTFANIPVQDANGKPLLSDQQIGQLADAARNPGLITPQEEESIKNMVAAEYQQSKGGINETANPLTSAISSVGSKIPYSGFKMNPLQIAAERAKAKAAIKAGAPGAKVAERFNNETGEDL